MIRNVLLLFILLSTFQLAEAGGPWPRGKNKGYAQLGFTYIGYNKFFDHSGKVTDLRRNVTDFTAQAYIDYGITNRLTMSAILPFKYVATSEKIASADSSYFTDTIPFGNLYALNMVNLGLKYCIIDKKVKFSAGLNAEFNVARYDSITALRTGPKTFVLNPYLSVGGSFGKFYSQFEAGYRLRLNGYSDEVDMNFEIGYSWNQKTYFILAVNGRLSMMEGSYNNNVTPLVNDADPTSSLHPNGRDLHTSLYPNNQQYVGYGLKFIQKIKKVHLNAGVYFGMGQMVAAAPSYNLGVAYEW